MRQHALSLTMLLILCLGATLADPFEATKWKVKVVPDDDARNSGGKEFDDTLTFKGSQFTTPAMEKAGFKPVQYEDDTRRFGPATFKAELKSDKGDEAKWTGLVTATTIKGELVWKKGGKEMSYTYTGERDDSK
jgi:hypothetical protein